MSFKFENGSTASIIASDERGVIVGRAEYIDTANSYLLRYKANDGRAVEQWWNEGALRADAEHAAES